MKILVTGAAGFIGSNLVEHLLERTSHRVVSYDALTYAGNRSRLAPFSAECRHEFVKGDIRDESRVRETIVTVDSVIHLAAETHVDRSIDAASRFVDTNVGGTETLLRAACDTEIDRFVHVSTDEVYGEILDGRFSESDSLNPGNPYAATKAGGEHLVESYRRTHDVSTVIVRPSNAFGPNQHAEKLIPKFITRAANGESLPIYGDGQQSREWTFVADLCRALRLLVERGEIGTAYNVGSGQERTTVEVAEAITDVLDVQDELVEFVSDRPGHDRRYALETSRIEDLGWQPAWSFEEGLEETVEQLVATGQE
jgi:dTDP-glucose 4,6-dehydratase